MPIFPRIGTGVVAKTRGRASAERSAGRVFPSPLLSLLFAIASPRKRKKEVEAPLLEEGSKERRKEKKGKERKREREGKGGRKKQAAGGGILALCLMLHGGVMVGDWN
jgi:hypothetical protein